MAESSNFMQTSIPRFDGHYDHWAMLMENLLRSKEYLTLIENGVITAPAGVILETIRDSMRQKYQGSTKVRGLNCRLYERIFRFST
jgi:hypothetical protein